MIVRPRQHWFRMLLTWRGSVLPRILPRLLLLSGLAVLVTVLHGELFRLKISLTFVPFTLIGLALAIFLGFRNGASYDRYWEARKLWGSLLNDTRSLTRQILTLPEPGQDARPFVHALIAFVHALRHQLRGTEPSAELARWLPPAVADELAGARFKPAMILLHLGRQLQALRREGRLDPMLAQAMERPLCGLADSLGGCERIAGNPLPYTYGVIIHRTVYCYCFLLPFGLVDSIGMMTPLMVAFVAYTFLSLEELSEELEEPFGLSANDLALDAMALGIETTLREMLGETDLPPAPEPVRYVLT